MQKRLELDAKLFKAITKAAKANDTDAATWIRQACREKLQRDEHDRAALAAHAQMQDGAK